MASRMTVQYILSVIESAITSIDRAKDTDDISSLVLRLDYLKRVIIYSCTESVKSQAYLTLVRPCLEYACSVWDPHTQKHCHDIEGVQQRAARFVKNCYVREPGTVRTNLLNDLNWHSLELRRKITRLTQYHV